MSINGIHLKIIIIKNRKAPAEEEIFLGMFLVLNMQ
jgi:hypothetical protein